jgi:hypothetical protein
MAVELGRDGKAGTQQSGAAQRTSEAGENGHQAADQHADLQRAS